MKRKKKAKKEPKVQLFLDSGAYSAFSQGVEIDINEYIDFIKKHEHLLDVYVNLDVIGTKSKGPTKQTAEDTLRNQKIMEKAGLNPMPVFHRGEPVEYLIDYIENYDYIGLGMGRAIGNMGQIYLWLDRIFSQHICDAEGMPKTKVHGFGMTSLKLMMRYPWYSVDSTSWVITGRVGSIFVPRYKGGEWVYDENSWKISVSARSPGVKDDKNHISNLSPRIKAVILDYIHTKGYKIGKSEFEKKPQDYELAENEKWVDKKPKDKKELRTIERVVEPGIGNMYTLRDEMNIIYFQDLEASLPKWPWAFKPPTESKQKRLL